MTSRYSKGPRAGARARWRIAHGWVLAGGALALVAGCQSYEPSPLDLDAHARAVDGRAGALLDPGTGAHARASGLSERLAAMGAGAPERFELSDGVAVGEGECVAMLFNPDLRMARLRGGVARAGFEHAGLWEDPVFGFDAADIVSEAAPLEYGFTIALTIPVSGRLGVERDRAGAEHEAALRGIVDAEWRMRAALREAWARWTIADQSHALIVESIGRLERIAERAGALEAGGELARSESRLVELELAQQRSALEDAVYERERAQRRVLAIMGLAPDADVALVPWLPGASAEAESGDEDAARLIGSSAALAVLIAEYEVAEQTLRLEVRRQYPDITLGTGYGNEDDDRWLIGVSVPIPVLNANRGGIATAHAERELARAACEGELERLLGELGMERAALRAARDRRDRHERTILPIVGEQIADLERLVELGEVNTLVLIDAAARDAEASQRLLSLRLEEALATIAIERIFGPGAEAVARGSDSSITTGDNE
ncbi:MAG: TolC family protein [Phycisphaerales bacterium]